MRLSLDFADGANLISAYHAGRVVVNARAIDHSVLISAERVEPWAPTRFEELTDEHFAAITTLEPELVVLGTGARQRFPHPRLTRSLIERGIGVEVMDTGAACRTYNIISAEGRRVVAALLMIREGFD